MTIPQPLGLPAKNIKVVSGIPRAPDTSMGHRLFTDEAGTEWTVYDVVPGGDDRRVSDRREAGAENVPADDRRVEDRRIAFRLSRPVRLTLGWLCFEAEGERRRLQPIPQDWHHLADDALAGLLKQARVSPRRNLDTDGDGSHRP